MLTAEHKEVQTFSFHADERMLGLCITVTFPIDFKRFFALFDLNKHSFHFYTVVANIKQINKHIHNRYIEIYVY
jgi:hypothetical protein